MHPLRLALGAGITYLAQGVSSDVAQLTRLIEEGMRHRGFALVNIISPCPTYDRLRTYQWWRSRLVNLDADPAYQPASREQATGTVMAQDDAIVGLIYRANTRPLDARLPGFRATPLAEETLAPDAAAIRRILDDEYAP